MHRPVGPFGLGCAQLGNLGRAISDETARELLEAAWSAGVRWFDTAPHYGLGLSERRLGAFLRTKPRHEFTVSTKVGRLLVPHSAGGWDDQGFDVPATHRRVSDYSTAGISRSLDESRARLGLDFIDLVLVHDPAEFHAEALAALRVSDAVHAVGVGTRDVEILTRYVEESDLDAVLLAGRYTLLDQAAELVLFPACLRRGVRVLNAGIFNSGVLAGGTTFEYADAPPDVLARARAMASICASYATTLPAAAIAFARRHPAVGNILIGADSAAQVEANAKLCAGEPPSDLWTALDGSVPGQKPIFD